MGSRTRVKVAKNKCAPPFSTAEFEIGFGRGIDRAAEILDAGLTASSIVKNGSWFSCAGERMGQGRAAALQWLREHPDECDAIVASTWPGSSDSTSSTSSPSSPSSPREPAAAA